MTSITGHGFEISPYFSYVSIFLFALGGALVGARRGYDLVGVFVVATATGAGGGLLRDILLQAGTPELLRDPFIVASTAAAALVVWIAGRWFKLKRPDVVVGFLDAATLGAYVVIGMDHAYEQSLTPVSAMLVGFASGVGGGLLRDILMRTDPQLLRSGSPHGMVAAVGCVLYALLVASPIPTLASAIAVAVIVFAIRMLTVVFEFRTRPAPLFEAQIPAPADAPSTAVETREDGGRE